MFYHYLVGKSEISPWVLIPSVRVFVIYVIKLSKDCQLLPWATLSHIGSLTGGDVNCVFHILFLRTMVVSVSLDRALSVLDL